MRKFIVMREPYTRYGPSEPMEVTLEETETIDALVVKLLDPKFEGTLDEWKKENDMQGLFPIEYLEQINGDGADYYMIKELKHDNDKWWLEEILS